MANPWFRMYAEFAHDPKIQMMSEAFQRRFMMLLCLRCNGNVTLQDSHVTFQLRISNEEWVTTKAVFIEAGLIDFDNNVLNWEKRQFASDSSAERVARHREKVKQECNVTVTPQIQNRTDTDTEQSKSKTIRANRAEILPQISDRQLVADWVQLRKTKKSAITATAIAGIQREVDIAGLTLEAALRICCERGWSGFKAEWIAEKLPNAPGKSRQSGGISQEAKAAAAKRLFGGNQSGEVIDATV